MPNDSTRGLKAFAILGCIALVLFLLLPVYLGYFVLMHLRTTPNAPSQNEPSPSAYNQSLGELASQCGGPQHLPCRPGLVCSNDPNVANSLGTCTRGAPSGTASFSGQVGDACTSGTSCSVGLVCHWSSPGASTCMAITPTSPHILSIKLDGTQPADGWYRATPGTKVTLTVQAANAEFASAKLVSFPGTPDLSADIGDLKKSPGGIFSGSFTVQKGLSASIDVIVSAQGGDQSALAVKVASTP